MSGYTKYNRLALHRDKMTASIFYRSLLILSAIATVLVSTYAMAGGIPKWVTKVTEDKEYLYFVGIKTGALALEDGKRSAINQAVTELVEHFEVRSKTRYYEKKTELETKLLDEIDSKSGDTRIKGVLLKDWYFEKSQRGFDVYVLVQYPKAELERERQRILSVAAEKAAMFRRAMRDSGEARRRGDIKSAFVAFAGVLKEANEMEEEGFHTEALGKMRDLLYGIEIKAVSGDGQMVEAYMALKEPLTAKVFINNGGAEIPLKGVPILFVWEDGAARKKVSVRTDTMGEARFGQYEHGLGLSAGVHRVDAVVDIEELLAGVGGDSDREGVSGIGHVEIPGVIFTLKSAPRPRSTRVLILIEESNMGRHQQESIVVQILSETLQQAGFRVLGGHEIGKSNVERLSEALSKDRIWPLRPELSSEADIAIVGTAITRKGSDNMGAVISTHADISIRAVDLESGHVLAQKNVLSHAGFGETHELAGIRSLSEAGRSAVESLASQLVLYEEVKTHANH